MLCKDEFIELCIICTTFQSPPLCALVIALFSSQSINRRQRNYYREICWSLDLLAFKKNYK